VTTHQSTSIVSDNEMWGEHDLSVCRKNNSKHRIIGVFDRRECESAPSSSSSTFNITELGTRICHLGSSNECGMLSYLSTIS
jgi:hypothetical protein